MKMVTIMQVSMVGIVMDNGDEIKKGNAERGPATATP